MTEPASKTSSAPSTGRIVIGVSFIVMWLLVHVALFYLFLTGGILTDLCSILRGPLVSGQCAAAGWRPAV